MFAYIFLENEWSEPVTSGGRRERMGRLLVFGANDKIRAFKRKLGF